MPTVHSIQAMRLPARHGKHVKAQVEGPKERTLTLFESDKPTLEKQELVLEDGAVELDE